MPRFLFVPSAMRRTQILVSLAYHGLPPVATTGRPPPADFPNMIEGSIGVSKVDAFPIKTPRAIVFDSCLFRSSLFLALARLIS